MFASAYGMSVFGLEAYLIRVEVDVANGLPGFDIVGLPTTAVREARDRVRAAIRNSGFQFPLQRITVNLAPADLRKESSALDLAIAIGILAATSQISQDKINGKVFCGELSLKGVARKATGILSMALALKKINEQQDSDFSVSRFDLICPTENLAEARLIKGLETLGITTLEQLVKALNGEECWDVKPTRAIENIDSIPPVDYLDIHGQQHAKRALEIAAAGGHNILLIGPPGSGKTLLARAYAGILPPLTETESMEVTQLYSVAGLLERPGNLIKQPPFRSPHHTATVVGIIGGGREIKPGELALANHGVLFLDELPEFSRQVLESLRQPLEDHEFTVTRLKGSIKYPAKLSLIGSMNPCPCGYYGDKGKVCSCTPRQIEQYRNRISGPVLDRIDMHVEVPRLSYEELHGETGETLRETSQHIKERVIRVRKIQASRLGNDRMNAFMNTRETSRYCKLSPKAENLLKKVFDKNLLSARSHDRILRVARTIADMAEVDLIKVEHIAEAVQFRVLDRSLV